MFNRLSVFREAKLNSINPLFVKEYLELLPSTYPLITNQLIEDLNSFCVGTAWFIPSAISEMPFISAGANFEASAIAKNIHEFV